MTAPSREEALATLGRGHRALHGPLATLSEEELTRPATIGEWSVADLIGHVASWEEIALQAIAECRAGRRPWIEDVFARDGVDELNAESIERKRGLPIDRIRAEAEEVHRRLVAEIEGMSDEEWMARAPYPTERRQRLATLLGSVLGAPKRPFGHAFAHLPDLDRFLRSGSTEEPDQVGERPAHQPTEEGPVGR